MTPARRCAFTVVRRVFEQGAYADRAFAAEAEGLDPRERALAMRIAYGTVQRRATLDHFAAGLSARATRKLDPPVLAALRIGLFQLVFLGGVAEHAAVNESVELVKPFSRGGAALVNAVLRRAASERTTMLEDLEDATPAAAAIMYSVPEWLAELWWSELGPGEARALLRSINEPAESAVRVNTLVASVDDVSRRLEVPAHAAPGLAEGLVLDVAHEPALVGAARLGRALDGRDAADHRLGLDVLELGLAGQGAERGARVGDHRPVVAVARPLVAGRTRERWQPARPVGPRPPGRRRSVEPNPVLRACPRLRSCRDGA